MVPRCKVSLYIVVVAAAGQCAQRVADQLLAVGLGAQHREGGAFRREIDETLAQYQARDDVHHVAEVDAFVRAQPCAQHACAVVMGQVMGVAGARVVYLDTALAMECGLRTLSHAVPLEAMIEDLAEDLAVPQQEAALARALDGLWLRFALTGAMDGSAAINAVIEPPNTPASR